MVETRDILLYASIEGKGEWIYIYNFISRKCKCDITEEAIQDIKNNLHCKFVTIMDEAYPEKLKRIAKPPFVLFYHGDLSLTNKKGISVIGSRNYSDYGKKQCESFVKGLSQDLTIISGLAYGIDAIAHQTCISSGGQSIAVLGSGINNCYP